ncbi:MAG: penicillin acylase family protein [Proteobacteria bacterium]|nr:penicillin acylase family protein [Pseudomonadota bacterium]
MPHPRKGYRWALYALVTVVGVTAIAGAGLWLWLRASLPQTDGEIAVRGLSAEVEIIRDRNGIPHIRAQSDNDAYFALGLVHAQDRLWQMDVMRRLGAGRLSEVVGEATVEIDALFRTLGLYHLAELSFHELRPEVQAALIAYADGVNAGLAAYGATLPPEFLVLDYSPEAWVPADSLVWGKLMAMRLSRDWRAELLRMRIAAALGPEALDLLFPAWDPTAPTTIAAANASKGLDRLALPKGWPLDEIAAGGASNIWAIAGARTESGKPLLANDPHLGAALPGIWYMARMEAPGLDVAGATTPGVPFVILGHNRDIAWGLTSSEADVEDLFIETPDPADPSRYLTPDGSAAFESREEAISVSGQDPVLLTVRRTRHGPVVSDALNLDEESRTDEAVLALSAPYLDPVDRSPEALWDLNRAGSWAEFEAALENLTAVQQNVFYADTAGHIGFVSPGRLPIRGGGDGFLPADGASGQGDWTGFIPYQDLPRAFDPEGGLLINANNRPVGPDYPYFIGRTWPPRYRAERAETLLDTAAPQDPATSAAVQADTVSAMALDLLPIMRRLATPESAAARDALARLGGWDGTMAVERAEPLIFETWYRRLEAMLLGDELGDLYGDYRGLNAATIKRVLTGDTGWCDDRDTAGTVETCAAVATRALDQALADIAESQGSDPAGWTWGAAHRLTLSHRIFGRIPVLGDIFALSFPFGGGDDTLSRAASWSPRGPADFPVQHTASLRAVYDLADLDASLFAPATGQSGHPFSRHFLDLAVLWRDFGHVTIPREREEALRDASGTLILRPAGRTP